MTEDGPDKPEAGAGHGDADEPRPRAPRGPDEGNDAAAPDSPERPDEPGAAPADAGGPTDPDSSSPDAGDSPAEDQSPVQGEEEAGPSDEHEGPDEGEASGEDDASDKQDAAEEGEGSAGGSPADESDDRSSAGSTSSSDASNDDYGTGADEWDQGGEDWDNYEDWGEGFDEGWRDDDSDEDEHQDYYYDEYDYQDDTATWQDDDEPPADDDEEGAGKKKLAKAGGGGALATTGSDEEEELDPEEAELARSTMSLGEHLEELRQRLIRALIGLGAAMVATCFFGKQLIAMLTYSYRAAMKANGLEADLHVLGVQEGFMAYFKVSLIAGMVIASPWVFYQMWQFVAAGLYRRERRYVRIAVPFSATLFIVGSLFFLFVVSKPMLMFFTGFSAWMGVTPTITLKQYISFITVLMLVFGLAFQTPLVVYLLGRMGLVSLATLRRFRRHVIVVFLIIAALVTSPSPVDQILLALPMWMLYELGMVLLVIAERKRKQEWEEEETGEGGNADETAEAGETTE